MKIPGIEVIANELETPSLSGEALMRHIDALKRRYDEPWRRHHNFEHPLSMFGDLIRFKDEVDDPVIVGWTFLYHDAICDPEADDPPVKMGRNEELSALLSEAETPFFLSASGVRKVAAYTRATAGHVIEKPDRDLEFFLDADLAILGSPPERYDIYAQAIREEYDHFPPELYVPGRINILRGLGSRFEGRGAYTTEPFRETYGQQAKANIAAEIEQLSLLVKPPEAQRP